MVALKQGGYQSSLRGSDLVLCDEGSLLFSQLRGEEMKKFLLTLFVVVAAAVLVAPAFATELWDPHLRGVDEGLAAGALPPPGLYFVHDSYFNPSLLGYGPTQGAAIDHANPGVRIFAYVDIPILLWVPGCKFLGADYGVAIAQPFDYTVLRTGFPPGAGTAGAQWGIFNTIFIPYILSWRLPCDFHVKTAFAVAVDDSTTSPGSSNSAGVAASGNGTYMFTPQVGISWLHAGWNVSAEFFYSFQTENNTTHYQSGDQFAADYTVAYTCGKWTFGVGAAEENQLFNDQWTPVVGGPMVTRGNSIAWAWSAGPLVGYNFGPCSLMFTYNFPVGANNEVGGSWFNLCLVVPLWK